MVVMTVLGSRTDLRCPARLHLGWPLVRVGIGVTKVLGLGQHLTRWCLHGGRPARISTHGRRAAAIGTHHGHAEPVDGIPVRHSGVQQLLLPLAPVLAAPARQRTRRRRWQHRFHDAAAAPLLLRCLVCRRPAAVQFQFLGRRSPVRFDPIRSDTIQRYYIALYTSRGAYEFVFFFDYFFIATNALSIPFFN